MLANMNLTWQQAFVFALSISSVVDAYQPWRRVHVPAMVEGASVDERLSNRSMPFPVSTSLLKSPQVSSTSDH